MNPSFRKQFSFFASAKVPIYLDSAATSQKLSAVLEANADFFASQNASVHRGAYSLANQATHAFEQARASLAKLINAESSNEVVFTSGATESINMIAQGLSPEQLSGDSIAICQSEHHANILPWQALAKRLDLKIRVLPLGPNGEFTDNTLAEWKGMLGEHVAIIACAHASNVLGTVYPIAQICQHARDIGALTIIDGTQAIAHLQLDVQDLACDFYVFSGHKMYGPSGIGVCWGRLPLLHALSPSKLGGEMVASVSFDSFSAAPPPLKFEAGTPNVGGAIGLGVASQFLIDHIESIRGHEHSLIQYLLAKLAGVPNLCVLGNWAVATPIKADAKESRQRNVDRNNTTTTKNKKHQYIDIDDKRSPIGIVSFYLNNLDNHALASALYAQNIALRYGQHCAMPLLDALGLESTLRVSLACYNDESDVDAFINALSKAIAVVQEAEHKDDELRESSCNSTNNKNESAHQSLIKNTHQRDKQISQHLIEKGTYSAFDGNLKALAQANNWPEKHRQLLLLSKLLPILPKEHRSVSNEISGCEAKVWLSHSQSGPQHLSAYSSSKLIRGILAVLLLKYNQLIDASTTNESMMGEAKHFDYAQYLKELGLSAYFSEGRKDGVNTIVSVLRKTPCSS